MPLPTEEAWRKEHAANRACYRVIDGEDPQLLAELRSVLPTIPADWSRVEVYAPPGDKEDEFPIRVIWVLGATGLVLIELMIDDDEGLVVKVAWFSEDPPPDGRLQGTDAREVLAIIGRAILRHRSGGHRVH